MPASRDNPWPWPIALAIITLVGLIAALVEDGVWDMVSWLALAAPIAVCLRYGLSGKRSRQRARTD